MKAKTTVLILALLILPVTALLAFETFGEWPSDDVPPLMSVKRGGTNDCVGEWLALRDAAFTWNGVSCSYFYFGTNRPIMSNRNTLVYDGYNHLGFGSYSNPNVIAVTYVWFSNNSWIEETDIRFNESFNWNCQGQPGGWEMDVENIAAHELGHTFGLDDLYGGGDSEKTMYGYAGYGETKKRSLHQDDIDGICYLYPAIVSGFKGLELLTEDEANISWMALED
jgi:hypothetical protein